MDGRGKRRLFSSLALRVFLISFVLVILPLLLYSIYMSRIVYRERVDDVVESLTLFTQGQVHYIQEIETNYSNFLEAFYKLDQLIEPHYKEIPHEIIVPILQKFATHGDASAIFFLKVQPNGDLVCENSTTLPLYRGVNFTPYFSLEFLQENDGNIFIAKDPVFTYSVYITFLVNDAAGMPRGVFGATIALDQLIDVLLTLRTTYETNITILSKEYEVISSTIEGSMGKKILFTTTPGTDPDTIYVEKVQGTSEEYFFSFAQSRRFAIFASFPQTDAILMLSIPVESPLAEVYKYLVELVVLLLFMIVVGGGVSFLLTIRMARPLQQLDGVMYQVGQGDLTTQFHRDPLGFEINLLGEEFNGMVQSLITYIEEAKKERAEKETYAKELQIGHEIQKSILPSKEMVFAGVSVKLFFQSAKEVAGDFYDWLIKEEELFVTIADGVGKGIEGCLYAFDLRSILRTAMSEKRGLQEVVQKTNQLFCLDTKETGSFVTAFIIQYNRTSHTLHYVNCGHNAPFLRRQSGAVELLKVKGIAFGIEEMAQVAMGEVVLEKGDMLILYTDGVNEAQNKSGALFTQEKLDSLVRASTKETPEALAQEILTEIEKFVDGAEPSDDMTLIILKIED